MLLRFVSDGSRFLDRYDIEDCFRDFGVQTSSEDLQLLLANYENKVSSKINMDLFLRDIKVVNVCNDFCGQFTTRRLRYILS